MVLIVIDLCSLLWLVLEQMDQEWKMLILFFLHQELMNDATDKYVQQQSFHPSDHFRLIDGEEEKQNDQMFRVLSS